MEEDYKINSLNFPRTKQDNHNNFYLNLKAYDLTEIKDYKNKRYFMDKNFLNPNNLKNNLINNEKEKNRENLRISFIKGLIRKPENMLYDGYLCLRKKPTINYLLKKTKTRENKKLLEENILFKHPYPLINYLSNRKVPNKSKKLITDILSSEFNDLSIEQKKGMKYKSDKSFVKDSKVKYPKIKSISIKKENYNPKTFLKTEGNFSFSIISKHRNPKLNINTKNSCKDVNLNRYLNCTTFPKDNSINKTSKTMINLKKFKSYDNNINLKEHSTMTDNISYLRKTSNKKFYIKNINHILKDISLLKYKNHIMSLNN